LGVGSDVAGDSAELRRRPNNNGGRPDMSATTLALPTPSARAYASSYTAGRRKLAVLVVALAFVMDLMDSTILTIALPTIQRHMHASLVAVNWMAAAYTLAFAVLLITGGRMGDVFGYKRLFLTGVAAFMASSMLVGLAWSPTALIVARLLQGAAAALMVPQVLSVVQLLYKADERVAINGMLGGLGMLATTLAPVVAALLIKANIAGLSWRPIFFINMPVCVAALALASKHLPAGRSAQPLRFDLAGAILMIAATGLLVVPLIEGRDLGWPAWAYAMIAGSILLFGVLARAQHHAERAGRFPLIMPRLFRERSFSVGLIVSLLVFATVAAFALTFSLLLQIGHRFTAIHTVLTALFLTAGLTVSAGAGSKKAIPALGRWSLTIGTLLAAAGTAATGLAAADSSGVLSSWQLAPGLFAAGAGMGMIVVPLVPFILSSVDPDHAGSASGVASAVQQLGGAIGIAVIGAVFFPQLKASASYGHAFMTGIWLQLALLGIASVLTLALPRRIAADAYKPHI
jgi:MFS family permease